MQRSLTSLLICLLLGGLLPIVGAGSGTGSQGEIPSPPVAGTPTKAELDIAIQKGTQGFIREFVQTSYDVVSTGYVDYTDSQSKEKRYGPKAYVAFQLYLLTHYLMYFEDLGIPRCDPLLNQIHDWFMAQFDMDEGKWLWSHEGCLHAKGMYALANFGHRDLVEKGYGWALRNLSLPFSPPASLPVEDRIFTMRQSGNIIQSVGDAKLSLTGKHGWEHGGPVPDVENSAKFLYALLKAGVPITDVRVGDLRRGLVDRILSFHPRLAGDFIGLAWYIFAIHKFGLDQDAAYERCLKHMEQLVKDGWRSNFPLVEVPAFRSLAVRALLIAGYRFPELDASINGYVKSQDEEGLWRLPRAMQLWGLTKPPTSGIKVGTLDGANTYLLTLSLIDYRRIKFSEGRKGTSTVLLRSTLPTALETDNSPDALAFKRACGACHLLPNLQTYSREAWPGVTRKMMGYIAEQGLEIPESDVRQSLRYLQRHALSAEQ